MDFCSGDAVMVEEVDPLVVVVVHQVDQAGWITEELRDLDKQLEEKHQHNHPNHKDGIWLEVVYKYESYVKEITLFKGFKTFASM